MNASLLLTRPMCADRISKGSMTMLLLHDAVWWRIPESEETRHRQRLAHRLARQRRWLRVASFAHRMARRAELRL